MKKIILLTLLCLFVGSARLSAISPDEVLNYSFLLTVGKSITIDPYSDCGLQKKNGDYDTRANDFSTTYNEEELLVTYQLIKGKNYNGWFDSIYTYTISPQKEGVFTFIVLFPYSRGGSVKYYQVTYTINAVDVTSISIPSSLSLTLGESYTYSPVISHPEAETTLTWSSSNPAIVSVDETGTITGNQEGEAVIYCTAENGVMAQSTVTVRKAVPTAITLSNTMLELTLNNYTYLTATIEPEAAANTIDDDGVPAYVPPANSPYNTGNIAAAFAEIPEENSAASLDLDENVIPDVSEALVAALATTNVSRSDRAYTQNIPQPEPEVQEEEQLDEIELAIPVRTADEILEEAYANGLDPKVSEDEVTGIKFIDFSDSL